MNRLEQHLSEKLEERKRNGNLRTLSLRRAPVDFYSNDYLGLATEGTLQNMMLDAPVSPHATGSTGSRLLSGNGELTECLEHTVATFHRAEAALVFNSGYNANLGLLASIAGRDTTIIYDELCHASLIDGMRLSLVTRKYKYAHNDLNELQGKIRKFRNEGPVIVVTESVFSMDGDTAPLVEIAALCEQHDAGLIVDEAHATGVIGDHGAGLVCNLGLEDKVFARIHTFGKALGCHGAAVVGSDVLKQYLINFARPFIYTTALPDHAIQAATCAYKYLSDPGFSNEPLHLLISYFRQCIARTGSRGWKDSNSAIQALVVGDNIRSKQLADRLQNAGLQVNAILHPTVPPGMERLRVCLHSFNTREQVDVLFDLCSETS